jgi:hypothetical protein
MCVLCLVDAFANISHLHSPIDKLNCVVSAAKAICACVDEARIRQQQAASPTSTPARVVIGADDLLLLFSYLLIHSRTRVPSLTAELLFLSDFIPEHQRCTMSGYYLSVTISCRLLLLRGDLLKGVQQQMTTTPTPTNKVQPALTTTETSMSPSLTGATTAVPSASGDIAPVASPQLQHAVTATF